VENFAAKLVTDETKKHFSDGVEKELVKHLNRCVEVEKGLR
jgi:hypothetical protein